MNQKLFVTKVNTFHFDQIRQTMFTPGLVQPSCEIGLPELMETRNNEVKWF